MSFETNVISKTIGQEFWTTVRTDVSEAASPASLHAEPDHAFRIDTGAAIVEIKADFASENDSATITVLRAVKPIEADVIPEWDIIGTVSISASSLKSDATSYGTNDVGYIDFRTGDRLAFFVTTLSGTVKKLKARFLS